MVFLLAYFIAGLGVNEITIVKQLVGLAVNVSSFRARARVCVCVCVCELLSCVRLFVTPWTVALQAPLSMESSR